MTTSQTVSESRAYLHERCKTETEIGGPEFHALSDPLANMRQTYCAECDRMFPLSEFHWADTRERIPDYYTRHGSKATAADRFLCTNGGLSLLAGGGFLAGIACGVPVGLKAGWFWGTAAAVGLGLVGALLGLVVRETLVSPRILRRVCGVDDTRRLR